MANQGLPGGQTTPPNINSLAAQGIQGAGMGTAQGLGYNPLSVNANQLSNTSLTPYMNQFTDDVVKANEADILRGAQMGLDHLGAEAQMANAYGGSRHGVAMGEMGRGVASQLAQSSAGLRQAGFQNAQQAAMNDINTNLQGQMANQQADLSAQGQRLGAANQLANISNLGFGMGQTVNRNLATQGAQQQALQQALFDAARKQYEGFVNHPAQGLGYVTGALNANPVSKPQTVTQTKTPGLFDYLTLGANAYTGNQAQATPY
jgi:hypothetical protein